MLGAKRLRSGSPPRQILKNWQRMPLQARTLHQLWKKCMCSRPCMEKMCSNFQPCPTVLEQGSGKKIHSVCRLKKRMACCEAFHIHNSICSQPKWEGNQSTSPGGLPMKWWASLTKINLHALGHFWKVMLKVHLAHILIENSILTSWTETELMDQVTPNL